MPTLFDNVWIESTGLFMPGDPVTNDELDAYIAPLNRASERLKRKILQENGIERRYYSVDKDGQTRWSNAQLAAEAARACLTRAGVGLSDVGMLATGSSGGDAILPGFANMVHGELAGPPMETLTVQGVCASSVGALQQCAQALELGTHGRALAVAAEMPSRLFKRSRFAPRGYDVDFDAHFLRWMLSDGAGAVLLTRTAPTSQPVRLRVKWVQQRSFSGDYPVCMQLGLTLDRARSYLDFPSASEAEVAGALSLRQDIRLLPHLFDVGIHEYVSLAKDGWFRPDEVTHFLCHYSSARFIPVVDDLITRANLKIPRERWYSNLAWRGNTGAASIFVMLAEFLQTHTLKPGDKLLCFIPESGRFTVAHMLLEAEAADAPPTAHRARASTPVQAPDEGDPGLPAAPHDPATAPEALAPLLQSLAKTWQDYRSRVWRTPLVRAIRGGRLTRAQYLRFMECWVPQVREGSKWMREGAASLSGPFQPLADLVQVHAGEEQNDFKILFEDYRAAGGEVDSLDALRRNPGGEALNAYLHALAATPNPVGLLGAVYVIEGTGQRIVPALLPLLKQCLGLPPNCFRFLAYHGDNDPHHLERWLQGAQLALAADPACARAIADTARRTAELYLMQFEHVLPETP
jgi:3-oxoacyl-[acyl-carrier-protein] synthase-3